MPNDKTFSFADEPAPEIKQPPSEAQRMLDWRQRWNKPTVRMNEILVYGPRSLRKRKIEIDAAQVLVKHRWLTQLQARKPNIVEWQVDRRGVVHLRKACSQLRHCGALSADAFRHFSSHSPIPSKNLRPSGSLACALCHSHSRSPSRRMRKHSQITCSVILLLPFRPPAVTYV